MTDHTFIELSDVSLRYGSGTVALARTSLNIDAGDFVALVGPSGCGKSTILKLVAGLLQPTAGAVIVRGREQGSPRTSSGVVMGGTAQIEEADGHTPPRLGIAFQNPTMLPWLTIRENVMVPLKIVPPFRSQFRAKRRGEFTERADALLAQVGLKGFGDKRPWQLSGGMLQRASLCRALIHDPQLLLLDEPFGALDQFTREELWGIMQRLWIDRKPTVLLVTHDLREASYLANRICVMSSRPGRILETRDVTFSRPRTVESSYAPEMAALVQSLRLRIAQARAEEEPSIHEEQPT